jgi:hypothetical protein
MRGKSTAVLVGVLATLAGALDTFEPASASAAACTGGETTSWIAGAVDNNFENEANWDHGSPSAACDAVISAATAPVIIAGNPAVKNLTVGSGQTLKLQDSPVPALTAVSIQNNGTIQLDCPGHTTCGSPQAMLTVTSAAADALANAGTFISAGPGNAANNSLRGNVTNTGTFQIDDFLNWFADSATNDTFTNKGTISISPTCTTGVCMYSSPLENTFINGAGGNITNHGGSKYLQIDSGNFTQGAGNTSIGGPVAPVVIRGNLTMTGAPSTAEIQPYSGGVNASGTVGPGQTILAPSGSPVKAMGTLINQGTIRSIGSGASLTGNITTAGGGLLDIAAQTSHSGGFLDATGGNILVGAQLNTGTLMNHGGQITGGGTVVGDVINASGILNPAVGIGSMTITGDYTQGAGATLAIEAQGVTGPQHDVLIVEHNVDLGGTLRIVPELVYFTPNEGDALKVIDYSSARLGAFSSSLADPAFTTGNPVNVGYDGGDTSVFAFIGPPTTAPILPGGSPTSPISLLNSPLYRVILESLQPNGSFSFSKKPVVFPDGKLGLEVDTSGSCRLTAVEKAVAGSARASALTSKKPKKSKKGLIQKVTVYANGSGTHIIPLNLTSKGKKLLKKKPKKGKASSSAAQVAKDPLVITCTPIVYPVAGFTDGTQITGIGQVPVGSPPAGQPSIPSGPPTVQPGGIPVVKKPVVPLTPPPAQPASPPTKLYKASEDLDKTVGAGVSFFSNGKVVTGFDASFRVVCGFPFPNSAPLESIHFDQIPALTILGSGPVIQGSFEIAQQNTSSPPTWITASVQGDSSNGYIVRVYERRAGCEGGTIFSARKTP